MTADLEETLDWKFAATAVIRAIDSSYAGPIYLLDMQEARAQPDGRTGGVVWNFIDLNLRDVLHSQGQWRGRGFATLIDASNYLAKLSAADSLRTIVAVAVHEFCHWLEGPTPCSESEIEAFLVEVPAFSRFIDAPISLDEVHDPERPPWHRHTGNVFGRVALHAAFRAHLAALEFEFSPDDFWNSDRVYQLAAPIEYFRALGREPIERLNEPLRDISRSPLPDRYAEFCERDLARAEAVPPRSVNLQYRTNQP